MTESVSLKATMVLRQLKTPLIGMSAPFRQILRDVERVAGTETTVLVSGETGTGKDLVARAIHELSPRHVGPFIPIDCGAMASELFDSELFGHVRGAFTGADSARRGKLRAAEGGTLFLDGVDHLSLDCQTRLLRVIQEREIVPVGESRSRPVNFRLVSSVGQDLPDRLQEGRFRRDLYFRINVVHLELPPLRERREDIPVLAARFLRETARRFGKRIRRMDAAVHRILESYDWPGNVRELLGVIECAVASSRAEILRESDLPVFVRVRAREPRAARGDESGNEDAGAPAPPATARSFAERVEEFQRRLLVETLGRTGWSYRECGRELGLAHHQVKYLCAKLGIRRSLLS